MPHEMFTEKPTTRRYSEAEYESIRQRHPFEQEQLIDAVFSRGEVRMLFQHEDEGLTLAFDVAGGDKQQLLAHASQGGPTPR